jgi:hypothetical protein
MNQNLRVWTRSWRRISKGSIVYTGATRELGSDLDAFEETLIGLLTDRK